MILAKCTNMNVPEDTIILQLSLQRENRLVTPLQQNEVEDIRTIIQVLNETLIPHIKTFYMYLLLTLIVNHLYNNTTCNPHTCTNYNNVKVLINLGGNIAWKLTLH